MHFSLRSKIIFITVSMMILTSVVTTVFNSFMFGREYTDVLHSRAAAVGQSLKSRLDRMLSLGLKLETLKGFENECRDVVLRYKGLSYAMVIDDQGKILFHSDPSRHGNYRSDFLSGKAHRLETAWEENDIQYFEARIPVNNREQLTIGTIIIGFPSRAVFSNVHRIIYTSIGLSLGATAFSIFLLVFALGKWVNRPIGRLISSLNKDQQSGIYPSQPVPIRSRDEIGELGIAFNRMILDLNKSRKTIRSHTDELEKIVEKRTQELKQANEQLERDLVERQKNEAEKRRLELQISRSQKLEAIGTLASGIAHDFNNILSSVIGFTELSIDLVEENQLLKDNLEEVLVAGKRARNLVHQILTFSRQAENEMEPLQVGMILKEMLKFLRATLPTTIDIRFSIESESMILGDPTQVYRVFMNLCTNAGHAMRENGGLLKVSLTDVDIEEELNNHPNAPISDVPLLPGSYIKLTVSDTGHGMSSDVLERIYDPFFTTKGIGEGTGMGLSVVHGIVSDHHGIITAYSELGEGTTFNILLPIVNPGNTSSPLPAETVCPTGTGRILFVDDEIQLVKMGSQMIESLGYEVEGYAGSLDALAAFNEAPDEFDLVISDMTMPKMTGDRLAEQMLKSRPDIPIILCTGFSARLDEDKCEQAGIKAFLYKPLLKKDLAEVIRRLLHPSSSPD